MAEPDHLKTVKLDTSEVGRMIRDDGTWHDARPHDGRFGEKFDDELSIKSVIWASVSIAIVTFLFFAIAWGLILHFRGQRAATAPTRVPIVAENDERSLPSGPRLQATPEEELVEMRREMSERLHGYGWVDEAAGIVHVPVEKAMAMVLENGVAARGAAPVAEAPPTEETAEQEGSSP